MPGKANSSRSSRENGSKFRTLLPEKRSGRSFVTVFTFNTNLLEKPRLLAVVLRSNRVLCLARRVFLLHLPKRWSIAKISKEHCPEITVLTAHPWTTLRPKSLFHSLRLMMSLFLLNSSVSNQGRTRPTMLQTEALLLLFPWKLSFFPLKAAALGVMNTSWENSLWTNIRKRTVVLVATFGWVRNHPHRTFP